MAVPLGATRLAVAREDLFKKPAAEGNEPDKDGDRGKQKHNPYGFVQLLEEVIHEGNPGFNATAMQAVALRCWSHGAPRAEGQVRLHRP
jgi:hypothetical protein